MEKTLNSRLDTFLPFQIVTVLAHRSLYTQSLWLSVKTITRIKRPNLWLSPQLYETRVVQHTFCRAGCFESQESSLCTRVPLLCLCSLISTGIWSTKEFQVSVHLSKKKNHARNWALGFAATQLAKAQTHISKIMPPTIKCDMQTVRGLQNSFRQNFYMYLQMFPHSYCINMNLLHLSANS